MDTPPPTYESAVRASSAHSGRAASAKSRSPRMMPYPRPLTSEEFAFVTAHQRQFFRESTTLASTAIGAGAFECPNDTGEETNTPGPEVVPRDDQHSYGLDGEGRASDVASSERPRDRHSTLDIPPRLLADLQLPENSEAGMRARNEVILLCAMEKQRELDARHGPGQRQATVSLVGDKSGGARDA